MNGDGTSSPSPFSFSKRIPELLEGALDLGITEQEFWNMTLAELHRVIESRQRCRKREAQERASFDYLLADLIGRSVGRIYNSANRMPSIEEAYPGIFDAKEIEDQKATQQDNLSAMRFRQFANAYNKSYKEVANKE